MNIQLETTQRQQQTQVLSPQQLQTLKYLQASSIELEQMLKELVLTNPVLEVSSPLEILAGDPVQEAAMLQHSSDDDRQRTEWNADDEEKRNYFFNSLTSEVSMQELLQRQLDEIEGMRDRNGDRTPLFDVCIEVLGNLDDNGYLCATDQEIAAGAGTDIETAEKAVSIVQSLNPPGIAGHDLRETLLLQMERRREKGSIAWEIVDKHLDELARNRVPQIAKELDVDISEVQEALERIRSYDPRPGQALSSRTAPVVVPEVNVVRKRRGQWEVVPGDAAFPSVVISDEYEKMQQDKSLPREDRAFLGRSIEEGRQIIGSLDYRKSTIEKIAVEIVHFQREFFENGPASLKPLLMSTVADRLGIHEATVSRAVANKYMRTPFGVFAFRYFFTQGIACSDGGDVSSRAIRARISALVAREDEAHPLSDQKIADILAKDGFCVARRTVAKYREEEGIPATSLRRVHK